MQKQVRMMAALGAFMLITPTSFATIVGYEDFDGGAINLSGMSNVFDFNAGGGTGGDVFGRVSPFDGGAGIGGPFDVWDDSVADVSGGGAFANDNLAVAGQNTSAFFAINDADGNIDGAGGNLNNAVWSFDISSAAAIANISMDLAAYGDFESGSNDGFLVEAQIDGGGYSAIFAAITNEAIDKTYRAFDDGDVFTLNDPLELFIDGSPNVFGILDKSDPTTGAFDSYTSLLLAGQSGSTLDIRVSWAGTPSGSEPMGIDNITINGIVPEPATMSLLAFGLLGLLRKTRRIG